MKYKVAAEVGGPEEREAFEQFEKDIIDRVGEDRFRLLSSNVTEDPVLKYLK